MAEVKQVSGSFSLSSPKKKPPTFSNNGVSSSFKHVYDDVFASSPSRKLKPSISFMEDDYAEVFGSSKSNYGSWSIPYSSIPIIDLPKENGLCNRGETVDYGGVFGGIDADSFGLPDGEELFDQLKKKPKTSSTYTLPRSQGQTMEAVSPGISNQSYGQLPTNGFCQSFDNTKHFDSGNTELATNATRRPRKSAHVRANSSHEVSATPKMLSSRTLVTRDDGQSQKNVFDQSSDDMKRFEPGKNEITVNGTSMPRKASHVRAYSSHDASVTQKTLSTETPVTKDDRQSPTNGFCQSSDNVKHFEPDNDGMTVNATSRPEKSAAHVRAYSLHESGTTQKILLSEAPVMIDDALVADSNFGRKQGKHSKHTSLDLSANNPNNNGDAVLQNLSGMSGSNLVDSSPGTCQPSDAEMNELSQSSDNTPPSKFEANEMSFNMASGATQAAGIHTSHESNDELHKLSPTQKTLSSRTHVLNEVTSSGIDIVVEEQRKHSYNTSSDPGTSGQNGVFEAGFQKASGLHESTSIDTSDGACQVSFEAGPSKVVKDAGIADGCDKVKKKGRRSRMSSLDLNDSKHSCELEGGLQRKPHFGSSYSFDASHDPCAAHVKVQPSKMYPSSSLPQYFPVESHYKISENPSCKNSQKNMYRDGVGSPPSLADELDVNSAAAVSAATLQRAIEEAEIRIRLAKEFLERERQGSTNLRFKDTLKVKVAKGIKKIEQSKIDESFPPVDSEMQSFSPLERKHITKNAEVAAGFEDQNNFFKDEEFTETKDADMSELVRGEDKCEGGEWEAAKHLNQIISGVKNRIASFMSWQTDTEKKEDPKGFETNIHQQQPEEVEHDLKDHEVFYNRTGENQGATIQGEAMRGVNVVKSPEASVLEENGRARGFTAKPEKVGNKVDITCNPVEPSLANFQFFAFRNQKLFEPLDSEVEEKKGHQDCREPDTENEPVINEVKDESLPFQGEEASPEELKGKFVAQDSMMQGDVYIPSDTGSSYDKAVEEHSSLPAHDELELSHEAGRQGDMSRNGDVCSTNDKIAEMVEDLFSMAVHDTKEHNYEEDRQDVMSRKSHIGYTNEENVEIVEKPCSLSGYDGNLFADEEERKDDMCKKSHLSSSCKEHDKIVEEIYTQTEHERTNVVHEEYNDECLNEERVEESLEHSDYYDSTTEKADMDGEFEEPKEAVNQHENEDVIEEMNPEAETWETLEATEGEFGCQENERDEMNTSHIEEASAQSYGWEEVKTFQIDCLEETEENVTMQASCAVSVEEGFEQNESLLSKGEEACRFVESSSKIEDEVYPDEEIERMVDITNTSSESEMDIDSSKSAEKIAELITEEPVLSPSSTESIMEVDRNELKEGAKENFISLDDETDMLSVEKDDVKIVEPQSQDNLENETDYWHESQENLHVEEFDADIDQEMEMAGIEAVHRRRRWFDHRGSIATAQRPSILEVNQTDLEIDQEVLDETELAGSVEIHAGNLDSGAEVASVRESEVPLNQDNNRTNVDTTPKRRRWFVKKGEEGVPEPLSLFEGVKVNLEVPLESTDEALMHKSNISGKCLDPLSTKIGDSLDGVKSDVEINGEKGQQSGEAAPRRKRWFESQERVGPNQQVRINGDVGLTVETDQESNAKGDAEAQVKHCSIPIPQEKDGINNKLESKEHGSDMNEANRRGKEKEKEKLAVERAIREARERAFAEARDRAKKDAAERPNTEARQRVAVGAQEKLGKVSSEGTSSSDKASVEAKLKAERAAVERATAEARERALQKALSEKSFHRSREQGGKYSTERSSSNIEQKYTSSRCSDASNSSEKSEGVDIESTQRRKARLERQKRTTERAAKALDEKNKRDIVAQKEQAAKNMLADALDAEVRRWSTGKEGNLRALLSTLQYILGPDSGWQPVSLTDLVAATAVRKAYKKATLCVHPDKLQQRGASIQQKHICEKVFDLLKEAWNKFNPDDR